MCAFKPRPHTKTAEEYRAVDYPSRLARVRPAHTMPPEAWRVWRVARALDVSRRRIYQLVREGRLQAIRLGPRQMRILRTSLEAYIEEQNQRQAG